MNIYTISAILLIILIITIWLISFKKISSRNDITTGKKVLLIVFTTLLPGLGSLIYLQYKR